MKVTIQKRVVSIIVILTLVIIDIEKNKDLKIGKTRRMFRDFASFHERKDSRFDCKIREIQTQSGQASDL